MEHPPAFQFYPDDWLSSADVTLLTLEQEGIYIRLICYCWREGSIPGNPEVLAGLIGKGATSELMAQLLHMFEPDPKNASRLIHARLEKERKKQRQYRKEKSKAGKNGAKSRWANKKQKMAEPSKENGTAIVLPLAKNGSLSPSLSLSPSTENIHIARVGFAIPTSENEAIEWAGMAGVPPDFSRKLYHQCEGRGWVDGAGQPIQMWSHYAKSRLLKENFSSPPAANRQKSGPTVHELRAVIQAKETIANELKNNHCGEGLSGWHDENKRQDYIKIRREIKDLNQQLSKALT